MFFKRKSESAGLSVVAAFFNMRREARRTLHSLSRGYQQLADLKNYEVHVIDNGSSEPLSPKFVETFGPEFHYHFVETRDTAPCAAINRIVEKARFSNVMILIDGARMLSPGIINLASTALQAFEHPFIYTIGMHLGPKLQNYSVSEGYDAAAEDQLLETVDWRRDGYSLFGISSPGLSSKRGFFSQLSESNCFTLGKLDFERIGRYQTRFTSPGGGLCNLEIFNRAHEAEWLQPVLLLGEASFHQLHGGVATNAPIAQHPWKAMEKEYAEVVGEPWRNKFRPPIYLGRFREECAHLYNAAPDCGTN